MQNNRALFFSNFVVALLFIIFIVQAPQTSGSQLSAAATAASQTSSGLAIKSIAIQSDKPLDHLVEGDVVHFTATLIMEDGSMRDGRGSVEWLALGYAGAIDKNGTFTAHLDPMVSEYGRAPGVVVALYKTSGKTMVGASPIFYVHIQSEEANLPG